MRSKALPTRRVLNTCAGVVLAAAIAGCTAPASNQTVSGTTLTVYAGAPPGGAGGQQARDVLAAEQLAFHQQAGAKVGTFKLRFVPLAGKEVSDNARTVIQDSTAIAYLGELLPGLSAGSLGITNAQDLLQVTPTDTAVALTQSTATVPNSPNRYYESLSNNGRTFARVVPTTSPEAKAQVEEMQTLHVSKLYVGTDGSQYGQAIAQAVRADASRASISVASSPAGADAVFYGASSEAAAARVFNSTASSSPTVKLFAPSALSDTAFASRLSPAVRNLYVSVPGFLPSGLTAAAKTQFVAPFVAAYHHTPAPQAIFGYEAMSAVLAVLRQAGSSAGDRATVVHGFFGIRNRNSVLGSYSINANGDTSIAPFVFTRLAGGKLVPFKFISVQG
jgi:branched-chain amino acid transport system substrate-binding protein